MKSVLLGIAAAAALATTASATTALFDFQSPAGDVGSSVHAYTASGLTITATGLSEGSAVDLFDKTSGGLENGLGLADDPSGDHEITPGDIVQIDVTAIPGFLTDAFSFQMGSSTSDEVWRVFGSNTSGALGTLLTSGFDQGVSHSLTSGFKYYDFTTLGTCAPESDCTFGNVLLHTFTATTAVPEPATWALMLIGVGGLGGMLRASRNSAGSAALA